jgi:hypothetical protein
MKKPVKTFLKIGISLIAITALVVFLLHSSTKSHSPEDTVSFQKADLQLEVFYNRPYKKERKIFGNLVPYGEVWRTGANDATTFSTNKDLMVDGSLLKAGKYTLWTIPMKDSWKVIFNSKMYPWGINLDEEVYHNPQHDALVLQVPTRKMKNTLEQFTISFEDKNEFIFLRFAWDDTMVSVPLKPEEI